MQRDSIAVFGSIELLRGAQLVTQKCTGGSDGCDSKVVRWILHVPWNNQRPGRCGPRDEKQTKKVSWRLTSTKTDTGFRLDFLFLFPSHSLPSVSTLPLRPRLRPLDTKDKAIVSVAVQFIYGPLRVLSVHEVDKREPARLAGLAIESDIDTADGTCLYVMLRAHFRSIKW